MLTFADLVPNGIRHYGNIHYFKWMMPAFGLGCILAWRGVCDPRRRAVAITALTALALPVLFVRIVPVPVGPNVPARMLFFQHAEAGSDMSKILPMLQKGRFDWLWYHDVGADAEEAVRIHLSRNGGD